MFLRKILALIRALIDSKTPKFELLYINEKDNDKHVVFKDKLSDKTYQYKLSTLLSKKNVLQQFSSYDACKMGYESGRYLSYKGKMKDDKNAFVNYGNSIYNRKTFC